MGAGGGAGCLRSILHLRDVSLGLNLNCLNSDLMVQRFNPGTFDENSDLMNEEHTKRIKKLCGELVDELRLRK